MENNITPAEFVKYAADNHIKFTLPEDNRKYIGQHCQDTEINYSFRKLHNEVVNLIIQWCHDNGVVINNFQLDADALEDSIKVGHWQPTTDSYFGLYKFSKSMVTLAEFIEDKWGEYYHFKGCDDCVGNGCDDCRDCEEKLNKSNLYKKARKLEEFFKSTYGITYREYKEYIKDIDVKEPFLRSV